MWPLLPQPTVGSPQAPSCCTKFVVFPTRNRIGAPPDMAPPRLCCSPALVTRVHSPCTLLHVRAACLLLPRVGHCPSSQPGMVLLMCLCRAAGPLPSPQWRTSLPRTGPVHSALVQQKRWTPAWPSTARRKWSLCGPFPCVPKSQGDTAVFWGHHVRPPAFPGQRCIGSDARYIAGQ